MTFYSPTQFNNHKGKETQNNLLFTLALKSLFLSSFSFCFCLILFSKANLKSAQASLELDSLVSGPLLLGLQSCLTMLSE